MSKEMFIASSLHETKVAVLEDDQLMEVYYERDTDVGLVGGIYKGRVSRVLPGMQSAFVDIGLERDAFLYVSDFFLEDQDEYDKIFEEAETRAARIVAEEATSGEAKAVPPEPTTSSPDVSPPIVTATAPEASEANPPEPRPAVEAAPPAAAAQTRPPAAGPSPTPPPRYSGDSSGYRRGDRGGRRRRPPRGRRDFSEHRFVSQVEEGAPRSFEILPGESLAKYSHLTPSAPPRQQPQGEPPAPPAHEPAGTAPATTHPTFSEQIKAPRSEIESTPGLEAGQFFDAPPGPGASGDGVASAPVDLPEVEKHSPPDIAATEDIHEIRASFTEPAPSETSIVKPGPPVAESATEEGFASYQEARPPAPDSPNVLPPSETASASPSTTTEAPAGTPPSTEVTPAEPRERTYTYREPYQRPHHAPRRGPRGRRGMERRPPRPGGRQGRPRAGGAPTPQIAQLLKEGQEILVQIAKEPLGTKGARITSHIALPGRYLVYMPTIDHIGVSRKIASEQERLRLRNTILENKGALTGGFIVRTAGDGRPEEELKADLNFLSNLWADIKARTERAKAPALIHRDLNLVQRILRDTLSPDFKSVRVDNETEYERVVDFVTHCQPSLAGQVKLYSRQTPLFEEFGVESEIEKALRPKVWLKSGGYIVINQTEALVAIDVNTGKYVGKTNRLEDTILKTNIDAVNEIVRQIRVRDLGGIIVIDFIDMDERRNRIKVIQALEDALRRDRAPTKVTSFHDFGLVAITRKRVKQSLERTLCEPCAYCAGAGWVKSATTICYEILAEARKMAAQIDGGTITLRVNPEVAKALKSREGALVAELESLTRKDVIIKGDPAVPQERFEIF